MGLWSNFSYVVIRDSKTSYAGNVSLVAPSGMFTSSSFLMGSEGWKIDGNKINGELAIHEPYSNGRLSHYIYGKDDKINAASSGRLTRPSGTSEHQKNFQVIWATRMVAIYNLCK